METGLSGKTVLITGATGGIGLACAEAFARERANIVLFSRTVETLKAAERDIRKKHGVETLAVAGDMTVPADSERLARQVGSRFGGADVLVLNTGRPPLNLRDVIDETDPSRWDDAHAVQLRGAVSIATEFVPGMVARSWGRVVGITSASVKHPMPHHGLSTIYRAGLAAYLKHLAIEIAASGVTVNMVAPASVGTESFLKNWNAEERLKMVPLRRLGTTDELASAVLYLASQSAGFITGVHLPVDGGMTASLT
ncbi:MAG: SDR family oxidoreductase [Rhodobiaceae bacterium]|nr:SDR family oxidoreductase [Rhodobiaceae bacterium]